MIHLRRLPAAVHTHPTITVQHPRTQRHPHRPTRRQPTHQSSAYGEHGYSASDTSPAPPHDPHSPPSHTEAESAPAPYPDAPGPAPKPAPYSGTHPRPDTP